MKNFKIYYILLFVLLMNNGKAQIAIGKTSISGISSILEFAGNTTTGIETANILGIILPSLNSSPSFSSPIAQNGTFIFDKQLQKVRVFENNLWVDLSDAGSSSSVIPTAGNETGAGVIMGASASSAEGVLVLESSNKALILPHIKNPHSSVKSPYPGMMCYDTFSNSIAVFDGVNWNYWK